MSQEKKEIPRQAIETALSQGVPKDVVGIAVALHLDVNRLNYARWLREHGVISDYPNITHRVCDIA